MRFAVMFLIVVIWVVPEFYPDAYLLYASLTASVAARLRYSAGATEWIDKIKCIMG